MNHPASSRSAVGILEIEALVSADLRRDSDQRRITPAQHQAFRDAIQPQPHNFDEVDELVESLRSAEFEGRGSAR